jgi:hypothetical protein
VKVAHQPLHSSIRVNWEFSSNCEKTVQAVWLAYNKLIPEEKDHFHKDLGKFEVSSPVRNSLVEGIFPTLMYYCDCLVMPLRSNEHKNGKGMYYAVNVYMDLRVNIFHICQKTNINKWFNNNHIAIW